MNGSSQENSRPDPREQERQWPAFVERVRGGEEIPFAEQWAAFCSIYAGRAPEDGPPPAWIPDGEQVAGSQLGRLMADLGLPDYEALYRWSLEDRAGFWAAVIKRLGIVFETPPGATADITGGVEEVRWLPGARMNITDSCFQADPDRPAVIWAREKEEEPQVTTYGELKVLVNRASCGFARLGLPAGSAVALFMPMNLECVVAYLAVVRAGLRVISIADSFSAGELARRLELGRARLVVTQDAYLRGGREVRLYDRVKEAGGPMAVVVPMEPDGDVPLREGDILCDHFLAPETEFASVTADPYDVTNILFSSGTTGTPKMIPWSHLTPLKCGMDGRLHQDIGTDDVVAWPTNIGWMMGPWLIYAALLNRAAIALHEGAPTGSDFARFVERAGVTMLGVVPSLVRAWRSSGALDDVDWSAIRVFSSTGEPSTAEDYLWLMSRTGYRAPVIEYLGGTEVGGGLITGTVVQPASPATFSTPALGIGLIMLDDEGRPAAEGEPGEMFVVPPSIGLSQCLLNGDHHKVYFEGCPAGPEGEVLRRHGDQLQRLHGGYFRARGRADDTMNLGGIKVSSLELEQIVDTHPAVRESAAVGVQPGGEGAEQLVFHLVLVAGTMAPGTDRLKAELQRLIRERLNPLFRIRDLVLLPDLPRTASNKLMRRVLKKKYLERDAERKS
jgi:acetyl-CoA synthetase